MPEPRDEPVTTARAVVGDRFPGALAAFLAGSATTPRRSATSDLDIVVVVPEGSSGAPFRETTGAGGWVVELFVHTPGSLERYRELELQRHRPVLDLMCADGLPLAGTHCDEVAAAAREAVSRGPQVTGGEWEQRRYAITDLLDDLRGLDAADDGSPDLPFVAARLLEEVTSAALLLRGRWTHTGKAAARALAASDPALLTDLVAAHREAVCGRPAPLDLVASRLLDDLGGHLREGYRAAGERAAAEDDRQGDE